MAAEQIDMGKAIIDSLLGLVPPLMVGGVFYVIMRSILRADSKERKVYAQIEAEERAKRGMPPVDEKPAKPTSK